MGDSRDTRKLRNTNPSVDPCPVSIGIGLQEKCHKPKWFTWNPDKGMRDICFLDPFLIRDKSKKHIRALTLVELLFVVAIVGTLAAIAVPTYNNYIDEARNSAAVTDIRAIEGGILRFQVERGRPPDTLAEAGLPTKLDPWGNPYKYTRIAGLPKNEQDAKCRWNKFEKPLNEDFDLYSMGKDGETKPKITHKDSYDDIIRANGGAYVGLASEY
jgi:general secretion pathway protein G